MIRWSRRANPHRDGTAANGRCEHSRACAGQCPVAYRGCCWGTGKSTSMSGYGDCTRNIGGHRDGGCGTTTASARKCQRTGASSRCGNATCVGCRRDASIERNPRNRLVEIAIREPGAGQGCRCGRSHIVWIRSCPASTRARAASGQFRA